MKTIRAMFLLGRLISILIASKSSIASLSELGDLIKDTICHKTLVNQTRQEKTWCLAQPGQAPCLFLRLKSYSSDDSSSVSAVSSESSAASSDVASAETSNG